MAQDNLDDLVAGLRAYVEYVRGTGVDGFPRAPEPGIAVAVSQSSTLPGGRSSATPWSVQGVPPRAARPAEVDLFSGATARQAETLDALRAELGDCRRCKLAGGRTHIVFGVGNPEADLMFIGEGPGRDEDLQGEPFVGRAGQLLTEIITKGMKLKRSDVYIANVIKCRPPENRNPEADEIAACEPFLLRQIDIVQPKVVVALGKFAAQTLLRTTTPISKLRGVWHDYHGIRLMPTLHPAYLLRNPNDKKLVWQDIKLVMAELGLKS